MFTRVHASFLTNLGKCMYTQMVVSVDFESYLTSCGYLYMDLVP